MESRVSPLLKPYLSLLLFVPAYVGFDEKSLKQMVQNVNATEVSEQEFLSDNVYYYSMDDDRMEIV